MGNRRSVEKAFEKVGADVGAHRRPRRAARAPTGSSCPASARSPRRCGACARRAWTRSSASAPRPACRSSGCASACSCCSRRSAEHEGADGLGLLPGRIVKLDARGLKLPHIGWNTRLAGRRSSPLTEGLPDPAAFYHVHSFVPEPADDDVVLGDGEYGAPFVSFVERGNVFGAQCHPEKSSADGLRAARATSSERLRPGPSA